MQLRHSGGTTHAVLSSAHADPGVNGDGHTGVSLLVPAPVSLPASAPRGGGLSIDLGSHAAPTPNTDASAPSESSAEALSNAAALPHRFLPRIMELPSPQPA